MSGATSEPANGVVTVSGSYRLGFDGLGGIQDAP